MGTSTYLKTRWRLRASAIPLGRVIDRSGSPVHDQGVTAEEAFMNPKHLACILAALLLAASGPSFADKGKDESGKGRGDIHQRHAESRPHHGQSYFHEHGL